MADILGMLKDQLSGPALGQISSMLGTDPTKARSAVETTAGTILAGLISKASTGGGAESLFNALKSAAPSLPGMGGGAGGGGGDVFGGLGDLLGSPQKADEMSRKGTDLAGSIFGAGKLSSILGVLGSLLGLGSGVTGKLMGFLLPLILGQVGKMVLGGAGGGSARGLTDLLMSQKDSVAKLGLPTNLLGELGINSFADLGRDAGKAVGDAVRTGQGYAKDAVTAGKTYADDAYRAGKAAAPKVEGGLPGWLIPALLIGALALGGLYAARSCSPTEPVDTAAPADVAPPAASAVTTEPAPAVVAPAPAVAPEPAPVVPPAIEAPGAAMRAVTLPDGTALNLPTGGLADQLVTYLGDPNRDPNRTFALDMASFQPGTTNLADTARGAFELLAKVFNAYKGTTLKLTGYADAAGDAAAQATRSTALATAVKAMMAQLGIDPTRIEVEGKGAAPADSDRAKTGGVDISITKF
jgi:outer membrane protein OmpA-like peptidoglycan-associated protein